MLLILTPAPVISDGGVKQVGQNAPGTLPVVTAKFVRPGGARKVFRLEVARTQVERDHGLMFRESLASDGGMVFVFEDERPRSFWMKNTLIPLDIIFIDADGIVVGLSSNAAPMTLDERRCEKPARFVVELNAHTAGREGIGPGTVVVFDPPFSD